MLFLLDAHIPTEAAVQLREHGIDATHAIELGLGGISDHNLLDRAAREGRILMTRNVRDFAPLSEARARAGRSFPGILFPSPSIPQGSVGGLVRSVSVWLAKLPAGENPIANTYGWLKPEAEGLEA